MDVQELADRLAIRELMDRYALACDGHDWRMYRDLFAPDAVIDYSEFGGSRADLDTTIEWLSAGLGRYAGLHHNMTTHHCEITGDTARAITYFIAYQTLVEPSGEEFVMEVGGFYKDRLARTDRWRITERIDVGTWLKKPWPERLPLPAWYGTMDHHQPTLLPAE